MSNPKANWAEDDSDSDDEQVVKVTKEESDDSESDDDDDCYIKSTSTSTAAVLESKKDTKKDISQLSKLERKALKEKELCDLDSLLSEFGVDKAISKPVDENDQNSTDRPIQTVITNDDIDSKKKKKKKDKKKSDIITAPETCTPVSIDVASILKNKVTKSKKSVENQAIVEALKEQQAKNKKKSKDKTKYSEYSY